MRVIFVVLVATSGLVAVKSDNIDSDRFPILHKCRRSLKSPELEICLKRSIESMKFYLIRGYPSLSIPAFIPHYEVANYVVNIKQPITSAFALTDIRIKGLTDYTISNVQITPNLCQIKFRADFPALMIAAVMKAKIPGKDISTGFHRIDVKLVQNQANVTIDGLFDPGNNRYVPFDTIPREYFSINKVKVNLAINRDYVSIYKTYDKHISEEVQDIITNNWPEIKSNLLPKLRQSVANTIQSIASTIYSNSPIQILMPN